MNKVFLSGIVNGNPRPSVSTLDFTLKVIRHNNRDYDLIPCSATKKITGYLESILKEGVQIIIEGKLFIDNKTPSVFVENCYMK